MVVHYYQCIIMVVHYHQKHYYDVLHGRFRLVWAQGLQMTFFQLIQMLHT